MKIKYDRRVMRIILTTAVVVSVPTLAGMICGVFFDDIVSTFCDVMMVTSVVTFCPMAGLWLQYTGIFQESTLQGSSATTLHNTL